MRAILCLFLAAASIASGAEISGGGVSTPVSSANGGTGVANTGTLTNASNTTITGGGTVALGGFTLTVPATGTAVTTSTLAGGTLPISGTTGTFAGNILPSANNTYDLGTFGAMFREAWIGVLRINPFNVSLVSPGDGILTLNNSSATDWARLQFGGNTSAFPALKRSGTTLQHRLANDSADGPMSASTGTFSGVVTVGGGTAIAKHLSATATLDFGSTAAGAVTDLTITVTGAALSDVVTLGVPNAAIVANGNFTAWVSASDTVTVRFSNTNLVTALDPASGSFRADVWQH